MNRCRRVASLLSAYIDGDLPPARARAVEAHLAHCAACRRELAEWRGILRMVSYHATVSCPIDCAEAVLRQIEDRQPWRFLPSPARRGRRPLAAPLALAVLAAAVVGGGGWLRWTHTGAPAARERSAQVAAAMPDAVESAPAPVLRVHAPDRLQQAFGRSDSLILAADFAEDGP